MPRTPNHHRSTWYLYSEFLNIGTDANRPCARLNSLLKKGRPLSYSFFFTELLVKRFNLLLHIHAL
jgi:hypothetical protein